MRLRLSRFRVLFSGSYMCFKRSGYKGLEHSQSCSHPERHHHLIFILPLSCDSNHHLIFKFRESGFKFGESCFRESQVIDPRVQGLKLSGFSDSVSVTMSATRYYDSLMLQKLSLRTTSPDHYHPCDSSASVNHLVQVLVLVSGDVGGFTFTRPSRFVEVFQVQVVWVQGKGVRFKYGIQRPGSASRFKVCDRVQAKVQ
ncbi:hypothetical protein CTI12_AA058920 [Artemisia annua]|uniref:Uncharacterized protein n=1 Tax=Artemisia annua TaxID=35608 RepID=A0A2U1Q1J0_ARTAN|nr:hypothetical protein CTI12_AA058920 [Artemisia annua]